MNEESFMDAGETPERVSEIEVTFLAPDAGWSRLTIRTKHRELGWRLSYVFDPFYEDFTAWLEAVVEHGNGTISINSEGNIADIRVVDAGNDTVRVIAESNYEGTKDLLIEIPKVSSFQISIPVWWHSGRAIS